MQIRERIQRKAKREEQADEAPALVRAVLRGPGQPLDATTRAQIEPRFGHDFSQVRIHTDGSAAASAEAVSARAYTAGSDIVFGVGEYQPGSSDGQRLIAHELAHVVQQRAGSVSGVPIGGGLAVSEPGDRFEREADTLAARETPAPASASGQQQTQPLVLQRWPAWLDRLLGRGDDKPEASLDGGVPADALLPGGVPAQTEPVPAGPPPTTASANAPDELNHTPARPYTPAGPNASVDPSLLQSQASSTTRPTRHVVRPYGSFTVYPDDFPATLGPPDYATGSWPVRESEAGYIDAALQSIEGGAAGVRLEGDATFRQFTEMDLAYLMTTPAGRELAEAQVRSRSNLTIRPAATPQEGNSTVGGSSKQVMMTDDGKPGSGSDATIAYNPQNWQTPYAAAGLDEPWMTRPPAVGLGHEMVHAENYMTGTTASGAAMGWGADGNYKLINNREFQATGLPFAGPGEREHSENELRRQLGLPHRPKY